jgi:FMN phosphatase YigB (HAD superfamily)
MQLGIKAIGFDLDGTLIKTHVDYDALRVADIEVFKAHGIPYEEIYGAMDHTERLRKPLKAWLEANDEGDRFQDISESIQLVAILYTGLPSVHLDSVHFKGNVLSVRSDSVSPVVVCTYLGI